MTSGWKVAFLILFVAAVVAVVYGFDLIHYGFSAKEQPSLSGKFLADTMRDLAIPRAAREQKNPWGNPAPPEVIAAGMAHWADHCATCHANDGSGKTLIGQNLYPKAPDMRLPSTQNLTDGELYYIIVNGVRLTGMPAWGLAGVGKEDENWHLVSFIRHLPSITPAELSEMEELNPKTDADRAEERQEEEFLNGDEPSYSPAEQQHDHH